MFLSLFLTHETDFLQKYLRRQPHVDVQAIKVSFIQQVCLQNFFLKQGNF